MLTCNIMFSQITHPMIFEVNNNGQIYSFDFGRQSGTGWGITRLPAQKVTGQLVWGYDITPDSLACDPITNNYANKIVMVRRGGACSFPQKILNVKNSGAIVDITFVNRPLLFCKSMLPSDCGNLPGITPPPTNKSVSPSASKSNAITQLPLDVSVGNVFMLFVKFPFPLLRYNLSW